MGNLFYGQDGLAVAAKVFDPTVAVAERGSTFGPLSAALGSGCVVQPVREWLADHVELDAGQEVLDQALSRALIAELAEQMGPPWPRPSFAIAGAISDTLLAFASEGLDATALDKLARRSRLGAADTALLHSLAQLWQRMVEQLPNGLLARTAVLKQVTSLRGPLVGLLDEFPGAIGAQTLMRALREHETARLGLAYSPDTPGASPVAQYFFDAAEPEHFSQSDHEITEAEVEGRPALDCPPLLSIQCTPLERALYALQTGQVDVVAPAALLEVAAELVGPPVGIFRASTSTTSGSLRAALRWAEAPRHRGLALDWVRSSHHAYAPEERRLLAASEPLNNEVLPNELRRWLKTMPAEPCLFDTFWAWAKEFGQEDEATVAPLIRQATRMGLNLSVARWAKVLLHALQLRDVALAPPKPSRTHLLTRPWLPTAQRAVLWLDQTPLFGRRRILSSATEQWLNRVGLKSFAATPGEFFVPQSRVVVGEERAVHRLPATASASVLPLPPEPPAMSAPTQVSVSELIAYVNCPQRYYLGRFVGGNLPHQTPLRPELSPADLGTLVHRAAERVTRPLLQRPLSENLIEQALLPLSALLREDYEKLRQDLGLLARDELRLEATGRQAAGVLRRDLLRLAQSGGTIHGIEWTATYEHQAMKINGRIDRVDAVPTPQGVRLWLWDLKSGRFLPKLGQPQGLQLFLYGEALGWSEIDAVGFVSLLSGQEEGVSRHPALNTLQPMNHLSDAFSLEKGWLHQAISGLRAADYAPRPLNGAETCQNCMVKSVCRFVVDSSLADQEDDHAA